MRKMPEAFVPRRHKNVAYVMNQRYIRRFPAKATPIGGIMAINSSAIWDLIKSRYVGFESR